MKARIYILVFALLSAHANAQHIGHINLEEHRAWSVAIDSLFAGRFSGVDSPHLLLNRYANCEAGNKCVNPWLARWITEIDSSIGTQICNDINIKCSATSVWDDLFALKVSYMWLQDFKGKLDLGQNNIIKLSRIGFSKDGNHAAGHLSIACGALCSQSHLIYLTKKNGVWRVSHSICYSMS